MKTCTMCGETKPLSEFRTTAGRAKPRANCRSCDTRRHQEWRDRNRPEVRAYDRARWQKTDRWEQHLRRTYGLSEGEYLALLAAQGGQCAICETTHPGGNSKRFHVDHDHVTGAVRGLLCSRCNLMLGRAGDSPALLDAAAAYLRASLPRQRKLSLKHISGEAA